jgi:predicted naringenin-chalcone synthase
MSFAMLGLGTALPPVFITQTEGAQIARRMCCQTDDQARIVPLLYRQSGIDKRHLIFDRQEVQDALDGTAISGSVFLPTGQPDDRGPTTRQRMDQYAQAAPPLALRAARQALDQSGLVSRAVTHLITVSCTGFGAPGVDIKLIKGLELAPTVQRTHVGFMGCHGALNGLRVARAFTTADPAARVLLCAVELCSLHFHYGWDPQKMVSNALFADGAAAVVGAAGEPEASAPGASAPADAWRVAASGSCLLPDSEDAMSWHIGDHGFEMTLSTRVPNLIRAHLRPWLEQWLGDHGLALDRVASWAIHPGGPRILSSVAEPLGL